MKEFPIIQDVDKVFFHKYRNHLFGFVIGYVFYLILVIYLFRFTNVFSELLVIPLIIAVLVFKAFWNSILGEFYLQFARANGYSYKKVDNSMSAEGDLFTVGNSREFSNILTGSFDNHPIRIFNYLYTIGSGKNKATYDFTVFEIDYTSHVPKIFLRSDKDRWYIRKPNFINGRRLTLEGDFDKYFDLFLEEKFEIEALQIFTPEVMQRLMIDDRKFNLEFINDKIYIYSRHRVTKKHDLESMYQLSQYLIEELAPRLQRMESSVLAMIERTK